MNRGGRNYHSCRYYIRMYSVRVQPTTPALSYSFFPLCDPNNGYTLLSAGLSVHAVVRKKLPPETGYHTTRGRIGANVVLHDCISRPVLVSVRRYRAFGLGASLGQLARVAGVCITGTHSLDASGERRFTAARASQPRNRVRCRYDRVRDRMWIRRQCNRCRLRATPTRRAGRRS